MVANDTKVQVEPTTAGRVSASAADRARDAKRAARVILRALRRHGPLSAQDFYGYSDTGAGRGICRCVGYWAIVRALGDLSRQGKIQRVMREPRRRERGSALRPTHRWELAPERVSSADAST